MNLEELAPKAAQAESFLKALANRHRLMILCELNKGELQVSELQRALGLSQSSLSQHLARLRDDNLVKTRRESQAIYYSLAGESVTRVIQLLDELFCGRRSPEETRTSKLTRESSGKAACSFSSATSRGRTR